ncbi:hypothetical protein RM549_06220 [Salegentibacter sp. F188]|uniref:Uncharacterized protein n=1 Tax=Autumnicola patrickiae TaxID=3075591 RepID=A0ABU3E080_9FLAO|nr:hypothetical protein [Salegentibacter sp. F188]MDT0689373.1 hypothetical protein [Salegentibacter sp. F188]
MITRQFKIVDEFGSPLYKAHASISSQNGAVANSTGFAMLTGNPEDQVRISFVGRKPKVFSLENIPPVVTLEMNIEAMPEVVVQSNPKETPKYLWPAIGATVGLLILMSVGSEPKKVTL